MRRATWLVVSLTIVMAGCGTMKSQLATDQLLISDAIERAADQLDFSALTGTTVYLDTQYMSKVTAQGFLNSDYIRSALRQRLMQNSCRLVKNAADADYIVEVRVGALGTDSHEVNYGIPASQPLTATAAIFSGVGAIPSIPEVSLAKKDERRGAAKIHVFAYRRETMEPVWEPNVSHGRSSARSTWFLGAGPFEKGTIYDRTQFAGAALDEINVQKLAPIDSLRNGIKIPNLIKAAESTDSETLVKLPPTDQDSETRGSSRLANEPSSDSGDRKADETAALDPTKANPGAPAALPGFAIPTVVDEDAKKLPDPENKNQVVAQPDTPATNLAAYHEQTE